MIFLSYFLKSVNCYGKYSKDKLLKNKKFRDYYIENIVKDSLAYAGTEMIRRTVGDAKVLELTSLENSEKKLQLEKELINKAVSMIMKN